MTRIINSENYFSLENNLKYFGSSQFKSFLSCEANAYFELTNEVESNKSVALLVGSYVDAHFEGSLDIFKAKNPDIFTKSGSLKSNFEQANYIIERIERDEMFMEYMSGSKQTIMVGEIENVPFKIKVDSLHKDKIVDLKVMKDFKNIWTEDAGKIPFVEAWGYDIQAAIYQEIVRQNIKKRLPFFIAGATKESETDIAILSFPQNQLDFCLEQVKQSLGRFDRIKKGQLEPCRCNKCDYCKRTKKLSKIVDYRDVAVFL